MNKVTIHINGMMCGMCEAHINDVLRKLYPRAKKVNASHMKAEATLLMEEPVNEEALRKAIDETGYTYVSYETEPYEKKGFFSRWK